MKVKEIKVSGCGWLCVKLPNIDWMAVFKLTEDQLQDYNEVADMFAQWEKVK